MDFPEEKQRAGIILFSQPEDNNLVQGQGT